MEENFEKIVLAGGCFWCTEAVFQRIEGVEEVISGYTGGNIKNPAYREICTGRTGHAEAIQITYNPTQVSLETLLEVFFATHDPTTLNRQGNDIGTQYRSAVFYANDIQKQKAADFIELLTKNRVFDKPIVTKLEPLTVFYEAEEDHQNYYNENKEQSYCQFIIAPKVEKIKKYYSEKLKTT
ncbi:peptide-methionine (S)-S-oxide reductase [Ulvibacter sp. MAR_2010_11]|uniref:peptide-methionine (S)-S-oxide reductase MsrA n=1 Tax=Ulvibacter sp. MAR_2010_11 TaxID=1250229 RepID=UPI000C2CD592|nr:peptide-methionine (S)-S-oxide reductase MsrA [Ulvibacter sp. MAR_2010_11]PKA84063.1 peptide-methionine (S)-S-oxide reductase [Ulvibacter sp. MAR_2010_11]